MPLDTQAMTPDANLEGQPGRAPVPHEVTPAPSTADTLGAAFRQSNVISMLYESDQQEASRPHGAPVEGFDPIEYLRGSGYEEFADRDELLHARTPQEVDWLKQGWRNELNDRDTIRRSGLMGTTSSFAAGLIDPISIASMAIPLGGPAPAAVRALRLGTVAAGTSAIQEAVARELDPTRTFAESALNVGSSAVLGGVLGAAIRPKVPLSELNHLRDQLNADPTAMGPADRPVLSTLKRQEEGPVPPGVETSAIRARTAYVPPRPEGPSVPTPGKIPALDPERMSLLEAAAVTKGASAEKHGISWNEALAQGLDPEDMKAARFGARPVFTRGGASFDEMAESLGQHGYPVTDESGAHSPNALLDAIDLELRGKKQYSPAAGDYLAGIKAHESASARADQPISQYEAELEREAQRLASMDEERRSYAADGVMEPEQLVGRIPRAKEGLLRPEQSAIEDRFAHELAADYEGAKGRYAALEDSRGGKVLNVDTARELSPDYLQDRTQSQAVHEPSSWFIKRLYAEKLAEAPKAGEEPKVLFTAGGTGAGKSTAIREALGEGAENAQIVYDTNMNGYESAVRKIEQAKAAGKKVEIAHVYRDPIESLTAGALKRAVRQEREFGTGRTVPLEEHLKTHAGSAETVRALYERYKDDPAVSFGFIDNSHGKGGARAFGGVAEIPHMDYNSVREKALEILNAEHDSGRISDAVYRGFVERTGEPAAEEGRLGGSLDRQPEPQRPEGRTDQLEPLPVNPTEESTAGAAAVHGTGLGPNTIARGARTLAEGVLGKVAPGLRLLTSPSSTVRDLVQQLAETRELLQKNLEGVATPQAIETLLRRHQGTWWEGYRARADAYRDYLQSLRDQPGAQRMSRNDFMRQVAFAMRRGDQSDIPQVAKAAADTRRIVFDPLYKRAVEAGLMPEQAKLYAESYLTRQYDTNKIRAKYSDWLDTLTRAFVRQGVDQVEARDIAYAATRNVLGAERGTMDWRMMDNIVTPSGVTQARTLRVPDEELEPFLVSDIDHLTHSYIRTLAPEVEMTERFGSRDLSQQFDQVRDEYARLMERARGNDPMLAELEARREHDIRDLTAIRDRLYGTFGQPKDPGMFAVRAGRLLRSDNALRLLGAATLAHIPDVANTITRYGIGNTLTAIARLGSSLDGLQLAREEARRIGVGLDMTMNVTASLLGDYGSHSQYLEQRMMAKLTRGFTILTGETPLITMVQSLASVLGQHELLDAATRVTAGEALPTSRMARLAASGIDAQMLGRINAQALEHGRSVNGMRFGMSDQWADQGAAQAFENAILKDAHAMTLSPGVGDTPLWMSTEMGKAVLQFKSFAFAAARHVVLPISQGVAQGDVRAMSGLMALATAGFMSYWAKQTAAGQPIEYGNPARMALEVLDKSNLMAWTSELIFPMLWAAGFKDLSRWSDRDPVETLGGPSAGTVASLYERRLPSKVLGDQEQKDQTFTRADLHFLRRLAPGQNLWYFRRAVNGLEDSIGDLFNLPGKSNADRAEKADTGS